jgi:sugar phosphate isomerase/epimerase
MRLLSLEHITAMGASPVELIHIAHEIGCTAISLIPGVTEIADLPVQTVYGDDRLVSDIRLAMDATGVRIHTLDALFLDQSTRDDQIERMLDLGALLNADKCTAILLDHDLGRAADRLARACELAAPRGIRLAVEFVPFLVIRTLREAADIILQAGSPDNALILVDALHLYRSGGSPRDIASVPSRLIASAQICDGPGEMVADDLPHEATYERRVPGDGVFPLIEMVSSLPADALIGIEVPMERARLAGVGALERSRKAVEGTRRVIADAEARLIGASLAW